MEACIVVESYLILLSLSFLIHKTRITLLWAELYPLPPPNSYVEFLTPSISAFDVFRDGAFKELIMVKGPQASSSGVFIRREIRAQKAQAEEDV